MIQSQELRVGNLISITQSAHKDDIQAVTSFMIQQIENGYKVFGVPISEEWLLRFGFEKAENIFHLSGICINLLDGDKHIISIFDTYNDCYCSVNVISHIHSVQNIFYFLTNQELQTTL